MKPCMDIATLTRHVKTIIDPVVRPGVVVDLPQIAPTSCDGCGACCMHIGYPPYIGMFDYAKRNGDPLWLSLTPELAAEARQGAVDRRGEHELPCVWLDLETRKCKHYELRPTICRDFDIGEPACIKFRAERGIA